MAATRAAVVLNSFATLAAVAAGVGGRNGLVAQHGNPKHVHLALMAHLETLVSEACGEGESAASLIAATQCLPPLHTALARLEERVRPKFCVSALGLVTRLAGLLAAVVQSRFSGAICDDHPDNGQLQGAVARLADFAADECRGAECAVQPYNDAILCLLACVACVGEEVECGAADVEAEPGTVDSNRALTGRVLGILRAHAPVGRSLVRDLDFVHMSGSGGDGDAGKCAARQGVGMYLLYWLQTRGWTAPPAPAVRRARSRQPPAPLESSADAAAYLADAADVLVDMLSAGSASVASWRGIELAEALVARIAQWSLTIEPPLSPSSPTAALLLAVLRALSTTVSSRQRLRLRALLGGIIECFDAPGRFHLLALLNDACMHGAVQEYLLRLVGDEALRADQAVRGDAAACDQPEYFCGRRLQALLRTVLRVPSVPASALLEQYYEASIGAVHLLSRLMRRRCVAGPPPGARSATRPSGHCDGADEDEEDDGEATLMGLGSDRRSAHECWTRDFVADMVMRYARPMATLVDAASASLEDAPAPDPAAANATVGAAQCTPAATRQALLRMGLDEIHELAMQLHA